MLELKLTEPFADGLCSGRLDDSAFSLRCSNHGVAFTRVGNRVSGRGWVTEMDSYPDQDLDFGPFWTILDCQVSCFLVAISGVLLLAAIL